MGREGDTAAPCGYTPCIAAPPRLRWAVDGHVHSGLRSELVTACPPHRSPAGLLVWAKGSGLHEADLGALLHFPFSLLAYQSLDLVPSVSLSLDSSAPTYPVLTPSLSLDCRPGLLPACLQAPSVSLQSFFLQKPKPILKPGQDTALLSIL